MNEQIAHASHSRVSDALHKLKHRRTQQQKSKKQSVDTNKDFGVLLESESRFIPLREVPLCTLSGRTDVPTQEDASFVELTSPTMPTTSGSTESLTSETVASSSSQQFLQEWITEPSHFVAKAQLSVGTANTFSLMAFMNSLATIPGNLIETARDIKSYFTYGGRPIGYNQTMRGLRRKTRKQIESDKDLCPEGVLEQISDRRLHKVIATVKLLFPNPDMSRATRNAIIYECAKAMKEIGMEVEEIGTKINLVANYVLIPNKHELKALISLNTGPTRATLDFKNELDRGTNFGEGLGIFSSYYKTFATYGGAIN